ncbi:GAF domain-containing protein [Pokkaliibacter sp. CJK22405]|uniref:GAF domain-containing protein n=1 Tax=Pokkaliibacter sp. CJK22405 TaxID=3384615 RepID=UPI00398496B9
MFDAAVDASLPKPQFYEELLSMSEGLLSMSRDMIVNLSQVSALLYNALPELNWAGFYLVSAPEMLKLAPFQGKVACVDIPFSKGVCGAAARSGVTQCIADVHEFPGHIACDAASRSELVVPLFIDGHVIGVLDLDSPHPGRFDLEDVAGIEALCQQLVSATDWHWQFSTQA